MGGLLCQNFPGQDEREVRRCTDTRHWYEQRKCSNVSCNGGGKNIKTICANDFCSFSSKQVKGAFICRKCFNQEKLKISMTTEGYVEIQDFGCEQLTSSEQQHDSILVDARDLPLFEFKDVVQRKDKLNTFILKHESGRADRECEFHYEVVNDKGNGIEIEWHGLSFANEQELNQSIEPGDFLKDPLAYLRLFLNKQKEYGRHGTRIALQEDCLELPDIEIKTDDLFKKYRVFSKSGEGGCATVHKCTKRDDGSQFALKSTKISKDIVLNECKLMMALSSLCNENIVQIYEVYESQGHLRIIEELMLDNFCQIVRDWHGEYSEDFCKFTLFSVARGLKLIHSKEVLHRDIKSDNILFNINGDIKIGDFGAAVYLGEDERSYCAVRSGTTNWLSPEIVKGQPYYKEADIWAFGCFAYELATGKMLFEEFARDPNAVYNAIMNREIPKTLPTTRKWSNDFHDFVAHCLDKNPTSRFTIDQLLDHKFLSTASLLKETWIKEYKRCYEKSLNFDFLAGK